MGNLCSGGGQHLDRPNNVKVDSMVLSKNNSVQDSLVGPSRPKVEESPQPSREPSTAPIVTQEQLLVVESLPSPAILRQKSSKACQIVNERIIEENGTIGGLNFTLQWWDPNDLDLIVICPCGN